MKRRPALGILVALVMIAGCASTKTTNQTPLMAGILPRPHQIWIYDFVAAPADMPVDSSIAGQVSAPITAPTPEEVETARKYGAILAHRLVEDVQAMGMPATRADANSAPQVGDGVIRGYLISIEGGGASGMAQRFVIGFGNGTAEMDTVVEGYAVTPTGWKKMGSGTLSSSGNKSPGLILPAAIAIATANPIGLIVVGGAKIAGAATGRSGLEGRAKSTADEIAAQLKIRFQDRGWIES